MKKYADDLNCWKEYEKGKNKELIDFSKHPEIKKKFLKLVLEIKKRVY